MTRFASGLLLGAVDDVDVAAVRTALTLGADPNVKNPLGTGSVLCMAALAGSTAIAAALLDAGADPNLPDEAPLVVALAAANGDVAALLVERGARIDHGAGSTRTALCNALAISAPVSAIGWLLERGADPNRTDESGRSPLDWAVEHQRADVVRALLARGADPNTAARSSETPLTVARYLGDAEIVAALEAAGAH